MRSGSSARLAAHAASSARCKPAAAARSSQRLREAWLVRAARAGTGCSHSKQRARPAWPVAPAARAASCVREFGAFPATWRRVVRRRRWSENHEQRLDFFGDGGWGREEEKYGFRKMSSINPLLIILVKNELTGENYLDWKRNLFNILTAKGSKYVLTQPCPPEPSLYDYRNQREPYEKWCEANKMAKRYILASISVELHKKYRSMETATEIMASLHQMFGQNTHFAREAALKRITDTKMEEGTKVRDHVLKMMDYLNEVEIHGVQINDKSKINMVIESLPDTFKEFKVSYILNNKDMTLIELMHELHAIEEFYHSRKLPEKGFPSRLKSKDKNEQARVGISKLSTKRSGKPKGKCYKCGQKGHWKKDCPKIIKIRLPFLNGHLEENIYMQQPDGFIQKGQEHMVCKLQRSIYGLKQASRSWNIRFDQAIKSFGFIQNIDEPCVYKKIQEKFVTFLILYVDDILLIGNDIGVLTTIKSWLAKQFDMKDLGEASYILGIKLLRDRKNKTLALSQAVYIDKILARFSMENSKTGLLPFRHGITFSKDQSPKTSEEIERMRRVPYATAVGSLMYAMLCTRLDICFAVWMVSRYQFNPGPQYWTAVKHIIKYLKRTKNYMLVYSGDELIPVGYTDSDFKSDRDSRKSTSGYVFALGSGAISWMSVKQSCITDSITKAEYVATSEAAKEAIWLCKFLRNLEVVLVVTAPLKLFYDNGGAVAQSKEPRNHKKQNILKGSIIL
ncbi:Integrase catalytic domain-containing protein [Citrus sinensis]|nr:Integrase catalytic domain-containing protein [Citrus sinensis]